MPSRRRGSARLRFAHPPRWAGSGVVPAGPSEPRATRSGPDGATLVSRDASCVPCTTARARRDGIRRDDEVARRGFPTATTTTSRDGAGKPCRASTPGSRPRARTLGSRCPSEHARRIHRDGDASRVAIDARRVRLVVPGAVVQRADSTAAFRVFCTTWRSCAPNLAFHSLTTSIRSTQPLTNRGSISRPAGATRRSRAPRPSPRTCTSSSSSSCTGSSSAARIPKRTRPS
jgi:hypothetical protein